ncbi:hypothetical protein BGW38_001745 [Lunasporangiospora selenospora]|uniref:PNK FHA domain-containing protein n=1 Tax=Lunasporangiospora selenospora TaxID=979761 RepID=A0A9P6G2F0_9FUNG|nr:hypothetical protein BGW38_001745 [Lunasporangiospora selenospora]
MSVIATIQYPAKALALPLHSGETLFLGRGPLFGINSPHVSRKQLEVIGPVEQTGYIEVIRRGTNRSLLDGKELPKDTAVKISHGVIITLLESGFPLTIDVHGSSSVHPGTGGNHGTPSEVHKAEREPVGRRSKTIDAPRTIGNGPSDPSEQGNPMQENQPWGDSKGGFMQPEEEEEEEQDSEKTSDSEEEEVGNVSIRSIRMTADESDAFSDESSVLDDDLSDLEPEGSPHTES